MDRPILSAADAARLLAEAESRPHAATCSWPRYCDCGEGVREYAADAALRNAAPDLAAAVVVLEAERDRLARALAVAGLCADLTREAKP